MRYLPFLSLLLSANAVFGTIPHAYVTNQQGGSVSIIDVSNDTVQSIFGFVNPRVVKVTADGTLAYVGSGDNTIRVIDTITHTVLPSVVNINNPMSLAITPDEQFLYIVSSDDKISVVKTSDYTLLTEVPGFSNPQDIKITPDGAYAYVSDAGNGTIGVIRTSDNTIVDIITGFQVPVGLTFTLDGEFIYVTDTTHNLMYVVRTSDNTIIDEILGLNQPSYVAVTSDKSYAFVSNGGNHTISVIRTSDNLIVGTIPIPDPKSVAVTQDGQFLYVGSDLGTVFKIRILDQLILVAIHGFENPSNISLTNNNAPGNSVNGCQVATNQLNIYNRVTWKEADGNPIAYQLYRNVELTNLIGTFPATSTFYIDNNRVEGQTYSYYVLAVYANGFSSTIGSVEVAPDRVCQVP